MRKQEVECENKTQQIIQSHSSMIYILYRIVKNCKHLSLFDREPMTEKTRAKNSSHIFDVSRKVFINDCRQAENVLLSQ